MEANCLLITGVVCKAPQYQQTPAGIGLCRFSLEHRSQQHEAGADRQVYCRIQVWASGEAARTVHHDLTLGSRVKVQGFLSRHETRNGLARLVLHAQQIERLD